MSAVNKVVIANNDNLHCNCIEYWLQGIERYSVTATLRDPVELEKVFSMQSDLFLITSLSWIKPHGNNLIIKLIRKFPSTKIIIFFDEMYRSDFTYLFKAGVAGFFDNEITRDEFINNLNCIDEGQRCFSKKLYNNNPNSSMALITIESNPIHEITTREEEILELISLGHTTTEIAEKLNISKRTVDGHRSNLIFKLGVKNTAGLIRYALKYNLIK